MVDKTSHTKHTLAYYCSGHGYGHATRVSAFTRHLLSLDPSPVVYLVSSAPQHVFADSIALGALYRNALIDPVIVQPVAYRVDRLESVKVLRRFIDRKPSIIEEESRWLRLIHAECVLSDAAFIGCAAANAAGIPSVLVTNFTFDSVYSYLSTPLLDNTEPQQEQQLHPLVEQIPPDAPIPLADIGPLVEEIWSGYRCADLLLRLPGAIPIPSFFESPSLPSPDWVDLETHTFTPEVISHLLELPSDHRLLPQIPFPQEYPTKKTARSVIPMPLLVRSPNKDIYTPAGRDHLLDSIGVPVHMRGPDMKVLIVSFGGQIFHKPQSHSRSNSRSHSRSTSRPDTPEPCILAPSKVVNLAQVHSDSPTSKLTGGLSGLSKNASLDMTSLTDALENSLISPRNTGTASRIVTQGSRAQPLLMVPGAPPASIPTSPTSSTIPAFSTVIIPPTPQIEQPNSFMSVGSVENIEDEGSSLLPDDSWIAIVCGVPKNWAAEDGDDLPESFFVAPRDVYMPDLTATADVLLGKLGYGTVSECVDACTPFVYVSRPLFIEEHGLRLFLEKEGVGLELSRSAYEAGDWAAAVQEAYERGKDLKAIKRKEGDTGLVAAAGREMAAKLIDWVKAQKDS